MGEIIERFTAKNYGCLKDVTVALTPLHAFIGPNDSGKSTILRGVRTAVQFAADSFTRDQDGEILPFDPGLSPATPSLGREGFLEVSAGDLTYRIQDTPGLVGISPRRDFLDVIESISAGGNNPPLQKRRARSQVEHHGDPDAVALGLLHDSGLDASLLSARRFFLRGARMLRLDPYSLRRPSRLLTSPSADGVDFMDEYGRGLPGVYDVILNQHLDGYLIIQANLRNLFPSVKALGLSNMSESTKELRVQLTSGEWIPARFMSEGMLYYLAFEAIRYLSPKAVLLIEEPENGLHPARIVEVIHVLREISKTTQVLLATHSPLVINEMQPDEVSVVTRNPETGTKITPMRETAHFEKRSSVYALGELWLSFADGKEEAPLIEGRKAS